jgi:hypothetical protein
MSFTFLNDSILSYKESYREFYQWHTENSTYYVRKYGWYFKSDIHGNIILKNNPPYSVSARDSSGYLIVIDTDSVDGNVNKAVYNPKRKPVEYTSSMGSSQFIQTYKYQYKGDTTIEQIITNYGNKVVPSDAKKIVTNKIIKKKKVIIKEEVVYAKFQEENQTSFRIKKYNKNKELIQIKLGNTGRKNLFQIFIPDHLNIRYYRNID